MSATTKCSDAASAELLADQDIHTIREWERFKWLAQGLLTVVDQHSVAELDALLTGPAEMPGQHEKVLVLLALKATPQSLALLEALDTSRRDATFRALHEVALRYARSRRN